MSIEDHRGWVAKYGTWTPPARRPGEEFTSHVLGQLATALERSEAELVNDVIARVAFNEPERVRVEQWARQALTIALLTAERAGSSGTRLSDNVLFHEIALRWSPAYVAALERGPGRVPSEMMPETLQAARDDIKAAGLRLQPLFELVTQGVAGWYETKTTAKGRRVRPLRGAALDARRAELGLPPLERVHGHLLRADDMPRKVYRRIETDDPTVREVERVLGEISVPVPPPTLDNYVLVADAKVTGETEFEPIRSGPRSRHVVNILDETRLVLYVKAARKELARLIWALRRARRHVAATIQPHRRIKEVRTVTRRQLAGSTLQMIETRIERDGKLTSTKDETKQMKRAPHEDTVRQREDEREVWDPPWSTAEIAALERKRSLDEQVQALRPVVRSLDRRKHSVVIKTQHRQAINRRWHPTSFWLEDLPGDKAEHQQAERWVSYDQDTGAVDEDFIEVTSPRGRLFRAASGSRRRYSGYGDHLEGVDISSSQYQILSVLLNDSELETALARKSAHQIAAERTYPEDPRGPDRAKLVLVAGGYGSAPDRINWKTNIPLEEVQQVLSSLGPSIEKYLEYTREVAYAVDPMKGFVFTDPFDGSEVVWRPIVAEAKKVGSDGVQLMTYVPAAGGRVNHKKLSQEIAPMLIHTLDSAFSGLVVEGLHRRGVANICALFDAWLVPARYLHENPRLFDEVIEGGRRGLAADAGADLRRAA
jgi:hypothetical protein